MIIPVDGAKKVMDKESRIFQHPFFAMIADCELESVGKTMENLRGNRISKKMEKNESSSLKMKGEPCKKKRK